MSSPTSQNLRTFLELSFVDKGVRSTVSHTAARIPHLAAACFFLTLDYKRYNVVCGKLAIAREKYICRRGGITKCGTRGRLVDEAAV